MEKRGLIAVQMMMLKDQVARDGAYETLKKLSELGYNAVEISQIPMTEENVSEIKRACRDFQMKVVACSAALEGEGKENLTDHFAKIVSDCKALDCRFLRIGMLPVECMGSKDKALAFAERMEQKAEQLAEHGIELYYHNHHIEFAKYDGEYLLDIIRENTRRIGFEIDVHWVQRGGEDPVSFIKKYKDRVKLLHLKDYRVVPVEKPEPVPGETAAEASKRWMDTFLGAVQFAEVGEGNLDFAEIIPAGLEAGSIYFIIEQDETYGRDVYESLRISRDNLIRLGYGDWFEL